MSRIQQSLLLCQKSFRNINPETLGWVRPDGIINFATKDAAKTYAINRCISANKASSKFERGVAVKDNMILCETDGKFNSVHVNHKKISQYADCDLYHNHPTPGTLSSADFGLLKTRKHLKTITAIDILGRCYTMTKLPLKKIKYLPKKLSDFITITSQTAKGIIKAEFAKNKYYYEVRKQEKEIIELQKHMSDEEIKKTPLAKAFLENLLKMGSSVDKIWCENAESLGIKYERRKL